MLRRLGAIVGATFMCCSAAAAIDLHAFWDNRCAECHGHAGAFARRHLTIEGGALIGRHNRDLRRFLAMHEAGAAQADDLYAMLLAQARTRPVYQQKCAGCHQTAAELARAALSIRDGVVVSRGNGRPISELLTRHGELAADEIRIVVDSLARVLREIGGDPQR